MAKVRYLEIGPEEQDQRIDNFLLRNLKGVPRSHVYRLLRSGQVRVNKGRIKAGYRLVAGDMVRLPPVRQSEIDSTNTASREQRRKVSEAILYEDDRLLVLDKPTGIAVHGGSGLRGGIIETLRGLRPNAPFLELAHRLDRQTSGLLLLAKKRSELRFLHRLLREAAMEKVYLALLAGKWSRRRSKIEMPLVRNIRQGGERMVKVAADGKQAVSDIRPLEYFPGSTLVRVEITTGRTHQIRVHASASGHPVIGDTRYGDRDVNKQYRKLGLNRLFLHAHSIRFTDQEERQRHFTSPLPGDLQAVVERLTAGEQPG